MCDLPTNSNPDTHIPRARGFCSFWRIANVEMLGLPRVRAHIKTMRTRPFNFTLVTQTGNNSTALNIKYFHRDHLGSTTAMSNEAGVVVERFAYEPFGKRRTPAGSLDSNNTIVGISTDRGFTNHEHLDELGLIHMNGRVYDPGTGRFLSADPGVPYQDKIQSYGRYSYTQNRPLISVDPSGFEDVTTHPDVGVTGQRLHGGMGTFNSFMWTRNVVQRDGGANEGGGGGGKSAPKTKPEPKRKECKVKATLTGVGGDQATADGALYSKYPNEAGGSIKGGTMGTVAVQKGFLGLTTRQLRTYGTQITITPSNQDLIIRNGGPAGSLTVSDYGDKNIQGTEGVAFDIYRFPTEKDGRNFGRRTMDVTIDAPDDIGAKCPE